MELSEDDVMEILKIFEQSKFDFLHLEQGELKLSVGKAGYAPAAPVVAAPAPVAVPAAAPAGGPSWGRAAAATPTPAAPPSAGASAVPAGLVAVVAPMVGKFYAQPSPADPAYVEVGSKVEVGGTLGLIEVMKVFTSVQAEIAGTVEQIVVTNGQSVEYGQTLFLLRPSA